MATGRENFLESMLQFTTEKLNNRIESLEKRVKILENGKEDSPIQKANNIHDKNGHIVRGSRDAQERDEHVQRVIQRTSQELINGDTENEATARPKRTSDARKTGTTGQCKRSKPVVSVHRPPLRARYFCAHTVSELRPLDSSMCNALLFLPVFSTMC